MGTINHFYDLKSWQQSRIIAKDVYELFAKNPQLFRDYPLKDQMRRSCGSIMDNIAEGFGRGNNKEFVTFLSYSKGSCTELMSQLFRAEDAGYIKSEVRSNINGRIDEVMAMNTKFISYLSNTKIRGYRYNAEEPEVAYGLHQDPVIPLILF